jgi:hypothetical protein
MATLMADVIGLIDALGKDKAILKALFFSFEPLCSRSGA